MMLPCTRMMSLLLSVFISFCVNPVFAQQSEYAKPGNYAGFIHMKGSPVKIPVSLDIVRKENSNRKSDLIVVMRLSFGGFDGHEYQVQNYTIPNYDWSNPAIALDANDGLNGPDISVIDGLVSEDGQSISSKIHTAKGGAITGEMKVVYTGSANSAFALTQIFAEYPIIPAVTGEYIGDCNHTQSVLQLEATKENGAHYDTGSPFDAFAIHGQFGEKNASSFLSPAFRFMLYLDFNDAQFNFYQPAISLPTLGRVCKVIPKGLDCSTSANDQCVLYKGGGKNSLEELDQPKTAPASPDAFTALPKLGVTKGLQLPWPTNDAAITGKYSGYIYMDRRQAFERMSLELNLSGTPGIHISGASRSNLSALSKIYIGDSEFLSGQFLYSKFQPLTIPDEAPKSLTFVSNDDPIMQITEWDGNSIAGIWYSKSFGHGGRFKLARHESGKSQPSILPPENMSFASPLHGTYKTDGGSNFNYTKVILQVVPRNSSNIDRSFPFTLRGLYVDSRSFKTSTGGLDYVRMKQNIIGGGFDPFTGVISLQLDNGTRLIGSVTEKGLKLHRTGSVEFHSAFREHHLTQFYKVSDDADPQGF